MLVLLFFSFLILFTFLIRNHPERGLYLILALLPTYQIRLNVFGLPTTLLEGMIVILFIVWIFPYIKNFNFSWQKLINSFKNKVENPIPKTIAYPTIVILITSWLSVYVGRDFVSALGIWKAYFFEAIIFFIICIYLLSQKKYQQAVLALGALAIINGFVAGYQYFSGELILNPFWAQEISRRSVGLFSYPNANSLLIAPLIPIFIGQLVSLFKEKRKVLAGYYILVVIFSLATIFWVKSFGAVVALATSTIIFLVYYKKTRLISLLFILAFSLSIPFTPIKTRIEKVFISTHEIRLPMNPSSWQIRAQQWRETWEVLKQSPVLGGGLNNYKSAVKPFHINKHIEIFLYPHNIFLNFWTEIGLIGLIGFLWLILAFFKLFIETYSRNKILTLSIALAMITLLVHGLVDVPYFKNDLALLFWFIIAGIVIIKNDK